MKDYDTYRTDLLVCPYCGFKDYDYYALEDGEKLMNCASCGKEFNCITETETHYSTSKKEE